MTPRERFEIGRQLYERGKYFNAQEVLQSVIFNYPGHPIVDTAQYYLALSYFGNEEYEVAEVEFNRLALSYPSSAYYTQAVFMRAVSAFEATPDHYGLDQTELYDALSQLNDFIIDFPESELIPDARKYLAAGRNRLARKHYENGIVYSHMGTYKPAKIYFQKVVDDYTETEWAPRAAFEIAYMDYKLKAYGDARGGFEAFLQAFPQHELAEKARKLRVEAAFKSGEKAFKAGEMETARELFESFKRDFPDHELGDKADKYLDQIAQRASDSTEVSDADS
jgi:outer membrane protein assembly factor BamD